MIKKCFLLRSLPWLLRKLIEIMVNNEGRYIEITNETFQNYNIKITTNGPRHPSAVVIWNENKKVFVISKVAEWVKELGILTNFACTEPLAVFSGFIHGLRHCYTCFMRTLSGISRLLSHWMMLSILSLKCCCKNTLSIQLSVSYFHYQ